ncbi:MULTISPECIES: DUF2254 domain-containing protein [unclassified Nocardia]|uniref:DUF2254 domain-containing protein n=1 Tax=unclassified Nocardia TaxID=2637762 RepID=UPI001CE48BE4|nr:MULTISPECIES: DUF2254 domain-containing protein [unclassified Nocardia]
MPGSYLEIDRRRDALRTNLWFVPAVEVLAAIVLFAITFALDRAAYRAVFTVPSWVIGGTPDAARQLLTAIAAAIITVVGVVFSITIVALTLASTQFGPRMLRTFIRDRGTQVTLGTFVASFVYAIAALVSIGPDFVPHICTTVSIVSLVIDLAVLIYFINHVAMQIQLPNVIAGIAVEVSSAVEVNRSTTGAPERGPSADELLRLLAAEGGEVRVAGSGYLQYIRYEKLVRIATEADAVIHLPYRPGHFLTQGQVVATVWPASAADQVAEQFARVHVAGSTRTLTQDISFGIDQLVEIALRALGPATNDIFTALACIDWLGDCLCRITTSWDPDPVRRGRDGAIRVIATHAGYERLVQRAFEKIRQSGVGMPAVMIRQLDTLATIMDRTTTLEQRQVLLDQAAMIERSARASVPEPADREDVLRRYRALVDPSPERYPDQPN